MQKIYLILFILFSAQLFPVLPVDSNSHPEELLKEIRHLLQIAPDDKTILSTAILKSRQLMESGEEWHSPGKVYLGAFYTLKGKHAFWPHQKIQWVKKGLALLDEALAETPDHIEVVFIHGIICSRLPSFFGRETDARKNFKRLVELIPTHYSGYSPEFIQDTIQYLITHTGMSETDKNRLTIINYWRESP